MSLGVGLIGCGAIGTVLAHAIDEGQAGNARLVIMYDLIIEKARALAERLKSKPIVANSFRELIECRDVSLVIEAASQDAVRSYAIEILKAGKDLMIMSVGALVDSALTSRIRRCAVEAGRKVYIPSGAIAGLDGIKSAAVGRIGSVTLTTRKPIRALMGAPYFKEGGIKLENLKEPTIIYEGAAVEACRLFPANVNVAAALSLAGIGPERTKVKIIADPTIRRNIHEIEAEGEFGRVKIRVENVPSPQNPKTSFLAALSAIATLRKVTEPIIVGT